MNAESKSYSDKLPRIVKGKTCQSLVPDGNLCGQEALVEVSVQGDPGVHEDAWVAVYLCEKHARLMEPQIVTLS